MIIGAGDSDANEDVKLQTPSKKRSEEGVSGKKSKRQKVVSETIESMDANNAPTEETTGEASELASSPIYAPALSSLEPDSPEACVDTPIQSHANVDLVAFNRLSSNDVARLDYVKRGTRSMK